MISNAIVLHIFRQGAANAHFNTLRILEDKNYQASWRQLLTNFANQVRRAYIRPCVLQLIVRVLRSRVS